MADYYFKMDDMAVGYQGKTLIHDINIGIDKGEIVTLIGPNGSGKSTILKSITKQLKLIGGKVFFDDTSLQEMSYKELSSNMAVVLTERIKTELMTCHEIVATGRYPYTGRLGILTPEDEQIVDEAMKAVHAEDLGNRDFNAISDGQKQRVLLARAICQEPEIIVLDEPTSFLDVRYKLELLAILERMARKKHITVIMSLHEIDLAQKVSDKIICVKGDTIAHYGKPEVLQADSQYHSCRGFLLQMECVLSVTVDKLGFRFLRTKLQIPLVLLLSSEALCFQIPDQKNHCQFHKDCGLYLP